MSVHRDRQGWRVKWREHGRQRSRSFTRKGDAERFDREMGRRLELGPYLARELDRSALTLAAFVDAGFRTHAATLATATRDKYEWALEGYLTELADEPLIALDVPRLAAHQQLLVDRGASANTVRDVMTRLSGVLQVAVEHGHVPANPVRSLRKVPADPVDDARPLAPVELERVIVGFDGRDRAIALLGGHLGLRPIEIRSVPWTAFTGATLTIGATRTKRTAARTRTIDVPKATARELRAWRLESGGRAGDPIVGPMTANALRLWGAKRLRPAVGAIVPSFTDASTYTLRHSHASALHYASYTPAEAARRMGHGLGLHWNTYAHVIESITGKRYADLDALIRAARSDRVFRQRSASADRGK